MAAKKKTTEQVPVTPAQKRNPTGKGGFGDNPQNRNPGGWKKEESISYQYNMLIRLGDEEFEAFKPKTIAEKIAYRRVRESLEDNNVTKGGSLMVTKEITDRIEGKATVTQSIDMTSQGESIAPIVRIIDERQAK